MDLPSIPKLPSWITAGSIKFMLTLLIILWIASRCASLFWFGMSSTVLKKTGPASAMSMDMSDAFGQSSSLPLSALKDIRLFGEGAKDMKGEVSETVNKKDELAPGEIPDDAPKTSLPLTLTGLISGGFSPLSTAMIKHNSKEASYRLNDKLPPNKQAVLVKVLTDRVIIRNAGRYESLVLFGQIKMGNSNDTKSSRNSGLNKPSGGLRPMGGKRDQAVSKLKDMVQAGDGKALSRVLNVTVAQDDNGKVKGYKVFPGPEKELFNDLGLERGDIITAVNGTTLDSPQKAAGIMSKLSSGGTMTFSIEQKNGSTKDIDLSL
ncbi:MAG: type II secretion system protein GspC [Pseudomonadota bacterium]